MRQPSAPPRRLHIGGEDYYERTADRRGSPTNAERVLVGGTAGLARRGVGRRQLRCERCEGSTQMYLNCGRFKNPTHKEIWNVSNN